MPKTIKPSLANLQRYHDIQQNMYHDKKNHLFSYSQSCSKSNDCSTQTKQIALQPFYKITHSQALPPNIAIYANPVCQSNTFVK